MIQLEQQEIDRMTNLGRDHEKEWLDEYIEILKYRDLWDIDFIEYKCYKVFISEYKKDIEVYHEAFTRETGKSISLKDAGWALYFIATNKEHMLGKEPAES